MHCAWCWFRYLRRVAILAQMLVWLLGLVTTTVAVFTPYVEAGKVVEWGDATNADVATNHLAKATLVLPVVTALISTITAKMLWRDKWSVCLVAASQLAAEIYKLRLLTCACTQRSQPQQCLALATAVACTPLTVWCMGLCTVHCVPYYR